MASARQIEIYKLHKEVCLANGHTSITFLHRANEGVVTAVPSFPANTDYQEAGPRSSDNPVTNAPGTQIWATWQPLRIRAGSQDAGDSQAARFWAGQAQLQFPAIDDNYNLITVQDDDFITDDQNFRYNIENPMLSSDGAFWTAVVDRIR